MYICILYWGSSTKKIGGGGGGGMKEAGRSMVLGKKNNVRFKMKVHENLQC